MLDTEQNYSLKVKCTSQTFSYRSLLFLTLITYLLQISFLEQDMDIGNQNSNVINKGRSSSYMLVLLAVIWTFSNKCSLMFLLFLKYYTYRRNCENVMIIMKNKCIWNYVWINNTKLKIYIQKVFDKRKIW